MEEYREQKNPWASMGITGQTQFITLLYNRPADCLIAQFYKQIREQYGVYSLYIRSTGESTYEMLPRPDDLTSFECPVTSQHCAYLLFQVMKFREIAPPNCQKWYGADWVSVSRMDLTSKEVMAVLTVEKLKLPNGFERIWVSDILTVWDNGEGGTFKVGMERRISDGWTTVDYWISDISFDSGEPQLIAELPGTFI